MAGEGNTGGFWDWGKGSWSYQDTDTIENRPWWMSRDEWKRRQAKAGYEKASDQWEANASAWAASMAAGWGGELDKIRTFASQNMPSYNALNWGDFSGEYGGYKSHLGDLAARIEAGYTSTDQAQALEQMLSDYGMTPEQWAQLQQSQYTTYEDDRARAEGIAFDPNSQSNKSFDAAMRAQQRAAEAGVGKQLETIFADRGGLGGFAAAQDYTLQMTSDFMRERSQYMTDQMNAAIEGINADKNRRGAILNAAIDDKNAYLSERWQQLQQAFQNTAYQADQVMKEFSMLDEANKGNFQMDLAAFSTQFDTMKDILLTQVGIDEATLSYMNEYYESMIAPFLNDMAMYI
jgi:hypothetical protein